MTSISSVIFSSKEHPYQSRSFLLVVVLLAMTLSGCGESKAKISNSETGLSESVLFESSLSKTIVNSFGFPKVNYDTVWIKEYSDPNREGIEKEIIEVTPDYCMPVASLYSDSPNSGALLLLNQSMDDSPLDSNLTLAVRTYADAGSAKDHFDLLVRNADRCGTWIPKDESGETGLSMDLWERPDSIEESTLAWSNGVYSEAGITGVVGSVIYDVYVRMDGKLSKAKDVAKKTANYVKNNLNSLQKTN